MNCICDCAVIVLVYGIERCAECGGLAGRDAFVPYGTRLPDPKRKAVR